MPVLCSAAIMGLGAYVAAIAGKSGLPVVGGLAAAVMVGAILGAGIGLAVARFQRDIAAVFSIALQATATILFLNLTSITGGPMGFGGISSFVAGQVAGREWAAAAVVVIVAGPVLWFEAGAFRGEFGALARAAGENPLLLQSLACDATIVSCRVFVMAFGLFALAGGLFAHYMTYVHPDSFALNESMLLLCAAVFGRRGGVLFSGAGVALLLLVPEGLRYIRVDATSVGKLRGILLGVVLCIAALSLARSMRTEREKV